MTTAPTHEDDISISAIRWLANGRRGTSSNTIFTHLTGVNALDGFGGSHPHDPADLCRCIRLLEACPELWERFDQMATVTPVWARLVTHWHELAQMLDAEIPGWRNGTHGMASRTYKRMKEIINQ